MATTKLPVPIAQNPANTRQTVAFPSSSASQESSTIATTAGYRAGLTNDHHNMLDARGIDPELAIRMGWRSGSGSWIDIPYLKEGVEVNCKSRTIAGEKRFSLKENGDLVLYNHDVMKLVIDEPLLICEGEMDCQIATQCGYLAVSVPTGAPRHPIGDKPTTKYDYLKDIPKTINKIILATDGDSPGHSLREDLAIRLGRHRCYWFKYPVGCKDLNEVFVRYGKRGVDETLSRIQPFKIGGFHRLGSLPALSEQPAFHVGIKALESHFKLRRGDFSVITGIPSHGKSTFANHLAVNMARLHGWHTCFASFEQPPQTAHLRALRTLYGDKPAHLQTPDQIAAADKWIDEHFTFIIPELDSDEFAGLDWLKERMAYAVTQCNASMIIIDPWNELDHTYDMRGMSLTQYTGIAIKELKRFAQRFMVHVMVIAHPTKMSRDKDGNLNVPGAYDISDSSHWFNKPEQVLIVHSRPAQTLIRIEKSRYRDILGKPGDVLLTFNDYNLNFMS